MVTVDIDSMTDGELRALAEQIRQAIEGRAAVAAAREAVVKAVEAYARAAGVTVAEAWRELAPADVAPTPEPVTAAEWEQRYGHNPYQVGDLVTYKGKVYRNIWAGNTYTPEAYPQGWQLVG